MILFMYLSGMIFSYFVEISNFECDFIFLDFRILIWKMFILLFYNYFMEEIFFIFKGVWSDRVVFIKFVYEIL